MHLALADWADDAGNCWPSQGKIASKARCSTEWVRKVVREMEDDGYLVKLGGGTGPNNSTRYRLNTPTQLGSSEPVGNPEPPNSSTEPPNSNGMNPPTPAPNKPSIEPPVEPSVSNSLALIADAPVETVGQRANRLTKTYTDVVKLTSFQGVRNVVTLAVKAGYSDAQITEGLAALADDGRPVTANTLRIQIEGMTPFGASAVERRNNDVLGLLERAAARDESTNTNQKGITA
jgi:DNA-binding Lrp family transcriptional regulator